MAQSQKKFPWTLTFFALIGVAILLSLGVWQIQRLAWKNELIAQMEEIYAQKQAKPLTKDTATLGNYVKAQGIFLNHLSKRIESKTNDGQIGEYLITPFVSEDLFLFVNRGWVSKDFALPETKQSLATLEGFLLEAKKSNSFIPNNDLENDSWYWISIDDLEQATGGESSIPYVLWAKQASPKVEGIIPQASRPEIRNDHLQYAFFWFAMATVLILIYGFMLSAIMKKN